MGREISEMTTFTSEDRQAAQKEMNNKPIAWIWSEDGCNMGVCLDQDKQIGKQEFQDYSIPLYTHPANACKHGVDDGACKECYLEATHPAELTDEEIFSIAIDCTYGGDLHADKFARAILRKAREQ